MVSLTAINKDNWRKFVRLKVAGSQAGFVASNALSLAQACYEPWCVPLGILEDGEPAGFCMYCLDPSEGDFWIVRLMVAEPMQSKGIGRKAMNQLISLIKGQKGGKRRMFLGVEPLNAWARSLYENLGFVHDGRVIDGELIYVLDYSDEQSRPDNVQA